MAIIYTYPVKTTPVGDDLILISDSADENNTKQVKVSTLPGGSGSGVSSVTAVLPLASTGGGTPAISLTGLTGFGAAGQVIKVNSGADGLEWGAAGGSTLPGGSDHSVQYKNGSAFAGGNDLTFHPTNNIFSIKHTVIVKGQGNGNPSGRLKLNCEQDSHAITLEGPAHSGGADYTLKFPSAAPANEQVLQYTTSGNLGWINTPSGSGISFNGTTANGIATYSNSTTANVSSVFTVSGSKLSAPAGTLANPSIEVGAIGGLYAASGGISLAHNGVDAIGVNSSSIVNHKLTQFQAGLKFGATGSTLDTYTEATWSGGPTLSFSFGGAATLSASTGSYRVIGDMVFAQFQFTFGSGGYGTADLSLPVSGLAGTGSINFVKMNSSLNNSTVSTPVTGDIINNAASIRLQSFNYDQDSGSHVSGQLFELAATSGQPIFQSGDVVSGTIIYRKS